MKQMIFTTLIIGISYTVWSDKTQIYITIKIQSARKNTSMTNPIFQRQSCGVIY